MNTLNQSTQMTIEPIFANDINSLLFSGAFRPTAILNIENYRFSGFAAYADLYKATAHLDDKTTSFPITAKVFRVLPVNGNGIAQLNDMLNILDKSWFTIGNNHENISPTWMASMKVSGSIIPAVATPYYCNGSILDYVCHNPRADRFDLICQAAGALAYIHSKGVVHGNICPNNICIGDDGNVRITDIGVDELVRQTNVAERSCIPSTWMYKPPEELEYGARTMQTDVYSLATTIYSIYLMKAPFPARLRSYGKTLKQIIDQGHDGIFGCSKPIEMSDGLWTVLRMSWEWEPSRRPSMSEVEEELQKLCGEL